MEEMFKEKNVVSNVDKFIGTMTRWSVQKHKAHHKTRSIQRHSCVSIH